MGKLFHDIEEGFSARAFICNSKKSDLLSLEKMEKLICNEWLYFQLSEWKLMF